MRNENSGTRYSGVLWYHVERPPPLTLNLVLLGDHRPGFPPIVLLSHGRAQRDR